MEKIQNLDFIEMYELLPEVWVSDTQDVAPSCRKVARKAPVTDILVWTECFALMAAVVAEKFPSKAPNCGPTAANHACCPELPRFSMGGV